ncbi:MAG: MFS transporter [Thalassobaculum sp.]|uniref:MFS transporter n=1 Tax=Thalassobaculum sp. TaxID=2022740 RepID=UPI0032ECB74E
MTCAPAAARASARVGWTLAAHFASSLSIGIAIGGMVPLIALTLEHRGIDPVLIGVNSAIGSLGVIAGAPLVPSMIRRFGAAEGMVLGLLLTAASVVGLAFTEDLGLWLVLRFLTGFGVATQWVVSETWMQAIVTERRRGLVMSVYVTSIAIGFAIGPVLLTFTGTEGVLPFAALAGTIAATALPMLPIRRWAPVLALGQRGSVARLLREAPTVAMAAIAVGLVDSAFFTFMPLYGLRIGLSHETAITLLTAVFAGNVILQVPLGWLADRVNRRALLVALGLGCCVGPAAAAWALTAGSVVAYPVLVLWGGAAFGIYTVAMTLLGERYRGGELAAANAAFVIAFELANLAGPPAAGWAMEAWVPHGLMVWMTAVALGFVAVAVVRGALRR